MSNNQINEFNKAKKNLLNAIAVEINKQKERLVSLTDLINHFRYNLFNINFNAAVTKAENRIGALEGLQKDINAATDQTTMYALLNPIAEELKKPKQLEEKYFNDDSNQSVKYAYYLHQHSKSGGINFLISTIVEQIKIALNIDTSSEALIKTHSMNFKP